MISVVMASYNAKDYINKQIDTIFLNISKNDELVIVDDCSNDGTYEILIDYSKKNLNLRLFRNEMNLGVNKTFERALQLAKGDYIVFADDDDIWFDKKIKAVLPLFNKEKVKMVVHDCMLVDEDENVLYESYFKLRNTKSGLFRTIMKPCYRGATMCFKRELLSKILPFPSKMDMFYDEWVSIMAEKYGKVVVFKETLSLWRRINRSVSSTRVDKNKKNNSKVTRLFKQISHRLKKILLIMFR